jgi:hypothetical protein
MKGMAMTLRDATHALPSGENILRAIRFGTARSTNAQLSNAVGLFAAGILIGAGLALLLAPKAGIDLRRDIEEGFSALRSRLLPPDSGPVPAREHRREYQAERSAAWPRSRHGDAE